MQESVFQVVCLKFRLRNQPSRFTPCPPHILRIRFAAPHTEKQNAVQIDGLSQKPFRQIRISYVLRKTYKLLNKRRSRHKQ